MMVVVNRKCPERYFSLCRRTYIPISKNYNGSCKNNKKKGKRKVQGVPQSQTAALPRHQEEEETDKFKQAQIEQTYEKH